ncbi:MAG: hypothetical protein K6T90_18825 [Leptolyngbyaceae cyanobacterium HOT.MB2.61]|nr:hypothetical protein [Leptolyngbyaceae cyanobacterium HOT.MB2.61]
MFYITFLRRNSSNPERNSHFSAVQPPMEDERTEAAAVQSFNQTRRSHETLNQLQRAYTLERRLFL